MHALRRSLGTMQLWEKLLLLCFSLLLCLGLVGLLSTFYYENTEPKPERGGTYIEGSVGTIRMLNPWFTVTTDVNRDIVSLVFAGLQRFDPFTQRIEDDLATLEIGDNDRVYTLTLRENLFWHDHTPEHPQPVTADDVIFTYQTIQQPGFPNPILQKNFRAIDVVKIDDRTVQFRLEKPYFFFRSNLTLGILPKHLLDGIPTDRLPEALDFNFSPVGCGPYRFKSIVETELSTEMTLERNDLYHNDAPFIERIILRAFPDYPSLLSDLRNLHGVRHVPRNKDGKAVIPARFRTFPYTLPQYVALFFNLDQDILTDKKLRLALQLSLDKQRIVEAIDEEVIIDTPLLELREDDWHYQFDPEAGKGALYDLAWHLPEKLRLQHLLEVREVNMTGALRFPQSVVLLATGASLTITGAGLDLSTTHYLHDVKIEAYPGTASGWSAIITTTGGSGSLAIGENWLRLTKSGGTVLDTFNLTRAADEQTFERLRSELSLVETFALHSGELAVEDLRTEDGILRRALEDEPRGIRKNDTGQPLSLRLLTSALPPTYPLVAEEIARQWRTIGVEVSIDVEAERQAFEDKIIQRDYDILLFGQPLLDNLDSYPYWHSSQAQLSPIQAHSEGGYRLDANNLSQFKNFQADALLEQIRETFEADRRQKALELLKDVFMDEVPAIVLYSPTYVFAVNENILGVDLGKPSTHSDRFLGLPQWFIKQGRQFQKGRSWLNFFGWLPSIWKE